MPLVETSEGDLGERGVIPQTQPATTPSPTASEVLGAAFRTSNIAGAAYDRVYNNPRPDTTPVKGFDPLASVPEGFEAYADRFIDASSPKEVDWIKQRIQSELQDHQTIARAGGWGVAATLAAGATDPLTIASMFIPGGGETRLAQMGRMALINAGTTAAQEGVLQQFSPTRTVDESMTNIGAGAILGGILGAAIRPKVPLSEFEKLRTNLDSNLGVQAPVNPTGVSTAGAAAVAKSDITGNTIAAGGKTIAEGTIGQVAPGLRLLTSPSNEARELVQQLAETREVLNKNTEGVATPTAVETVLRGYEGDWYQGWKARGDAFRDYRERLAGSDTDETPMSRTEFNQEVAYAMRRGDQSAIPEVADAAAKTRAIVFDPLKARAQALGLLPDEVKAEGADSYLMRQYDAQKIKTNLSQWYDTLTDGFVQQGVDRAEARDIAYKATRNVLGSERGTMDWRVMDDIVPRSGRLKERTLTLPDTTLEPFLNSDIDHLSHSYLRSMAPEVEFTERFGSRDMKDQLDSVRDEYARLSEQATGNDKMLAQLDKRRDADIQDLSAIRDRLYGTFGQPKDPGSFFVRAGRLLRSGNALRLLGAATLAHIPDIANVITRYGLPNTFAAIGKLGTSWNAIQLARAEARRLGIGLDMVMNSTAALLGDYGSHSQFAEQRLMSRLTRAFTITTGETPLISTIQSLASVVGQDELLRNAEKIAAGKLLPQRTMTKLAAAGIDRPMLERIAAQADEHVQEVNKLRFGMSDKWTDQGAAQAFESAILKDAHAMTLSPGAGDLPLVMSTEVGKLLLQFKSFAFAASRHVILPLAQGVAAGDVRAMTGLLTLASAGFLSYAAKQKAAGQSIEAGNPGRLALEMLDKSNVLGWTGEMIYPAIWQLGFKDFSRWSDRDATETLLGPSIGTVASVYERRLLARSMPGDDENNPQKSFNRSDLHFLRRLAPGQNLWYFRRAVNGLEDSMGDLFDLPGVSQKERAELAANQ